MDARLIERVAVDALIPYARNSRAHSDEQIAQIAGSIREFGFTNPVLIDAEDGIIAGHGRVLAAQKLGIKDVPCIRLSHLTDMQKKAYVIADNKLSSMSTWDKNMLEKELKDLSSETFDMQMFGFDDLLALTEAPTRFEKSQPNNFHEQDEDESESKNLSKYPLTVILDENEFAEWDEMKSKAGHSDKRLLLELMRGEK